MRVLITGASGLVGSALRTRLEARGDQVVALSRSKHHGALQWDPERGVLDGSELEGFDAVVHLAGEGIANGRWNEARRGRIRASRVQGTQLLVDRLAATRTPPRVLVSASAIGIYGNRDAELLTEASATGTGFLADLCSAWEAAALAAQSPATRVVCCRIGVVLSPNGGALQRMLLPFRLGLGGRLGHGHQFMSWITLADLTRVLAECIDNPSLDGPVNAVAPGACTNREFTKALGRTLHRPTLLPAPATLLRLALGAMADELLLAGTRVQPAKLEHLKFRFDHTTIEAALCSVLGR